MKKSNATIGTLLCLEGFLGFEPRLVRFKVKGGLSRGKPYTGRVRAVPRLSVLYPGICLATEQKARKTPSR